jgi:uncharacterized DUF497 family protein
MFEWDDGNRGHIWQRHQVRSEDVEQAMADPSRVARAAAQDRGEFREGIIGMTEAGRLLVVIFTWREGLIRVVTARPARPEEAEAYLEANQ